MSTPRHTVAPSGVPAAVRCASMARSTASAACGAVLLVAGALALGGCGSGSSTSATVTNTLPSAHEAQTASAASSAVGVATDAGLNQLFVGGAIALRTPLRVGPLSDGAPYDEIMRSVADAPPAPAAPGAAVITTTGYSNPVVVSGQIGYEADTAGLAAGWYHVALTFSASNAFTIRSDEGNMAAVTGGRIDLYVHNQDGSDDGVGGWTRQLDSYVSIADSAPVTVTVTLAGGVVRTSTLTGLRHVGRAIKHTRSGSLVTRADAVTVDGDLSAVPLSPPVGSGPTMLDRAGANQVFTRWVHAVDITEGGVTARHVFQWDRHCTYTVTYTYLVGALTWTGSVTGYTENVYVARDGTAVGPLTDLQLALRFGLLHDLNGSAAHF